MVLVTLFLLLGVSPALLSQQLAFPHAEGFGRFAKGGRGGDVYHVTTLEDYNPKTDNPIEGSLRHAILTQEGPRTIVFDISGTIRLKAKLRGTKSYLTIAGQTAPGDGITIRDNTFEMSGVEGKPLHDVIIRFIRFRHGDVSEQSGDGITTNWVNDIIFDHISASWTVDGTHDLRSGSNFTMQWSIFAEALNSSVHYRGKPHAMLASYRDLKGNISLHHNLLASSRNRHPTLGSGNNTDTTSIVDFRNNIVFNWYGRTNFGECRQNFINNYYKPGESSDYLIYKPIRVKSSRATLSKGFLRGNYFLDSPKEYNTDNYTAVDYKAFPDEEVPDNENPTVKSYNGTTRIQFESKKRFVSGVDIPKTDSPEKSFKIVLERAGASYIRDAVDNRIVAGVKDGSNRLIDSQAEVGGWPELKSKPAPLDSDKDGMPDSWEIEKKLNSKNPDDGNYHTFDKNFTNFEIYLNSLVEYLYKRY